MNIHGDANVAVMTALQNNVSLIIFVNYFFFIKTLEI